MQDGGKCMAEKGQQAEGQEQIDIWSKTVACYTGEFLPNMIGEDWVTVENMRCRDLYAQCVQKLCEYNTEPRLILCCVH